ncbi:MAG TPA: ATP-binding protein [Candidatus Krumholzibacteria bacterium]|nr:ATP-binding protein [Candidatus Krumholzibacteria bacterium]
MKTAVPTLAQEYADALAEHLEGAEEVTLHRAWALGRRAVTEGHDLLDLVSLHHDALRQWLGRPQGIPMPPDLASAQTFLAEALSPFEMAHRQFQEAVVALRGLNQMLEEEARRIAQGLHDDAAQLLVTVYLALDAVMQEEPRLRPRLREVRSLLDGVEQHLRRLSHELHPSILDGLGLVPALEFLVEGVSQRTGIPIEVEGPLENRLPIPVETALYRVVQEAVTNATRHAQPQRVQISIAREASAVTCSVRDDGAGFDTGAVQGANRGLGLVSMRERIHAVGGRLQLHSSPGSGTELVIQIPLEVDDVVPSATCR